MINSKNSLTTTSLTTSDIQNKSEYKAESQSFSAGGGYGGGKTSMNGTGIGFSNESGNASSTTTSGVSGIAGDKTVRSDKDNSNALKKTWNGKELQQDVEAQAKIMETFGKEAAKGIGTYATSKLNALKDQIKVESDPAKKTALQNEAKNWDEGGVYRTTLHAAAGALGGGVGGALGATASSVAMPAIAEQIKKMDAPDAVKLALAQVAAAAIGAAVGGSAGLASSVSVEANNRQLHEDGKAKEKTLAKKLADGSNGQYTQAQIEDALRSANNNKLGETASTGAVVPYDAKTNFAIYDKTGMILGKAPDGSPVLMQNLAMLATPPSDLQSYIKNNTGNTYSWNGTAPQLSGTPSAALPSIMPGTVTPEMLANRQNNAADAASWVSTQSGRFSSAATAYGTYLASQPNAVSQAGALTQFGMAGTATVVGFGAGAVEQLLRPNVGQTWVSGGVDILTGSLGNKFPLLSPAFTEFAEALKDTTSAINLQNTINSKGKK